jgi:hypothetical protein
MKRWLVVLAACHTPPPPPPTNAAAPVPVVDAGFTVDADYYETEALGPLHARLTGDEIVKLLGVAHGTGTMVQEGATGYWVTTWSWPGVEATVAAEQPAGPWNVRGVAVFAPSQFATKRGVHVGSTRAELERAYARSIVRNDQQSDPTQYLVGSPYGGMLFELDDHDRVRRIAIDVFAF